MSQADPSASSSPSASGPNLEKPPLPSGLVAFVKRDCPTCELVAPVLAQLGERLAARDVPVSLTVYTQDDPEFPPSVERVDDTDLSVSWHHDIEAVPTLLRVESGREVDRALGWHRG